MTNPINIVNANLHHTKGISEILCRRFEQSELDVASIQEPLSFKNIVLAIIIQTCKLIHDNTVLSTRAAMLVNARDKIISFTESTKRDIVAAIIKVQTTRGKTEVCVDSAYCLGDTVEAVHSLKVWTSQLKVSILNITGRQITNCALMIHFNLGFLILFVCFSGCNFKTPVLINMLDNEHKSILRQFPFCQIINKIITTFIFLSDRFANDFLAVVQLWDESFVIL